MKLSGKTFFFFLIAIVGIWVSSNISWGKDKWKGILESDARGYYAYLPATIIYHDLNLGFFDSIEGKKYYDPHYYYDYRVTVNGHLMNKYWCGTSICELPFFLIAHITTTLNDDHLADGYSKLYPIFINLAAIFYLMFGIFFLEKLLLLYGVDKNKRLITISFIFLATNLFYYALIEPGMTHVYSFAWISFFLYHAKKLVISASRKSLLLVSLSLGIIFLIRPQNIIVVLLFPFLAGSFTHLSGFLKSFAHQKTNFSIGAVVFVIIIFIQLLLNKLSCNSFFADTYPGESFNFLQPHFVDILFSYRKGLFLYTPFYLVCFGGFYYLYKQNSKWESFSLALFLIALIYLLSSWHNWWYGGSFSSRVFVDYLPLFALLFGLLIQNITMISRRILLGISIVLVFFCQMQIYQYRYNQITWDGMTKERYWDVFLRLDRIK